MKKIFLIIPVIIWMCACTEITDEELIKNVQAEKIKNITAWKNNPRQVISEEEAAGEIQIKIDRIRFYLENHALDGVLLSKVRNVNWITAGQLNTQIVLNKDVGVAAVLITSSGRRYVVCDNIEATRIMDETMTALGFELIQFKWYESKPPPAGQAGNDSRASLLSGYGKVASDVPFPGTADLPDDFQRLRYSFTGTELSRYRWLGKQVTEAVAEVCLAVRPGMDEYEIEALTAASLNSRGILPTVLLVGVDDRIFKYRHALPFGQVLNKYAMINVVAEKWGMPVAVTRFVHFGNPPAEIRDKLDKTAFINAMYEHATVPGARLADIWEKCKDWYAEVGFEGEWELHHQGGAIGYNDREYVIYPGIDEEVQENQPFAWNPTIRGTKVEDTIIAHKNGFEVITVSTGWPVIEVEIDGRIYPQPDILVR